MTGKEMIDAWLKDKPIGFKFTWRDIPGAGDLASQKKISSYLSELHLRTDPPPIRVCEKQGNTYIFEVIHSASVRLVKRRHKTEPLVNQHKAPTEVPTLVTAILQLIPTKDLWSELTRRENLGIEI